MSEQRPKGVIGQWYTLTSDFYGARETEDRKAGYTWQCEVIDGINGEPTIEGVSIGCRESYRLASPEEIARAKGEEPQPSKPSKEAREFWERVFLSFSQDHNLGVTDCLKMADEAMAEWQKRFE